MICSFSDTRMGYLYIYIYFTWFWVIYQKHIPELQLWNIDENGKFTEDLLHLSTNGDFHSCIRLPNVGRESTSNRLSGYQITGHLRNLNWRYLPYIRPNFQGISPQNMAKHMVLTNLHFRILKFPLKLCLLIYNPHELYTCIYPKPWLSHLYLNWTLSRRPIKWYAQNWGIPKAPVQNKTKGLPSGKSICSK